MRFSHAKFYLFSAYSDTFFGVKFKVPEHTESKTYNDRAALFNKISANYFF
jgi:hypothetical protein